MAHSCPFYVFSAKKTSFFWRICVFFAWKTTFFCLFFYQIVRLFFCPFGVHSARKDKKDKKDRGHSEGSVVAVYFQMLVLDVFFYEVNLLAEKTLLSGGELQRSL